MYVELKNVVKTYDTYRAADNIDLAIEEGRLVALLGPSGSGKTTILRMIAGLEHQDSGDIIIDGRVVNDVPGSERGIGFVFQNYALFRYMTVFDNIAFGLEVQKRDKAFIRSRVEELIALTDLKGLEKRYPNQLSGGQRQRVAFARAIAPSPRLLLLDEPFAAIDAKVRKDLRIWLRQTISRLGVTSIFVTHDQEEAIEVADEIVITNRGHIEQTGTPMEICTDPKTAFVARFIGRGAEVSRIGAFSGFESAGDLCAIVQPEFVHVFRAGEEGAAGGVPTQAGVVQQAAFRGTNYELQLTACGETLTAFRSLEQPAPAAGEVVQLYIARAKGLRGEETVPLSNRYLAK